MASWNQPQMRSLLVAAFCFLSILILVPVLGWQQAIQSPVVGFFVKLGFFCFALWLAWPNLEGIARKLPPFFVLPLVVSILLFFVQPRIGIFLVLGVVVYYFVWRVYRVVFGKDNA